MPNLNKILKLPKPLQEIIVPVLSNAYFSASNSKPWLIHSSHFMFALPTSTGRCEQIQIIQQLAALALVYLVLWYIRTRLIAPASSSLSGARYIHISPISDRWRRLWKEVLHGYSFTRSTSIFTWHKSKSTIKIYDKVTTIDLRCISSFSSFDSTTK